MKPIAETRSLASRAFSARFAFLLACVASAVATAPVVEAGVFSVTPVRIYMAPRDRAVAVTIVNEADTQVVLQADLNIWTQKADGSDELTLTDDLILSPPIIKLAPKAKQVVRLALLRPADAAKQLTYRLILREIPEIGLPDKTIQIPIALALSMPVFITPPPAAKNVTCSLARNAGQVNANCANSGTAYAQIREMQIKRGDKIEARFEGGTYVLPGATKTIAFKAEQPIAAGAAQLFVAFDDGKSQTFEVMLP